MTYWCAVHTHAQAESKAASHLRRQGFEVFLPRYRKTRRHARRVETVPAPLFPRYLFVALDPTETRWRPILSTVGVSNLVRFGTAPAAVPTEVIDGIRAREDEEGFVAVTCVADLRAGDRVRIVAGPMSDVDALFECARDNDRVTLLLELLGRRVRVRVPARAVARSDLP
jgi:transcriptional antiterminator RfaH